MERSTVRPARFEFRIQAERNGVTRQVSHTAVEVHRGRAKLQLMGARDVWFEAEFAIRITDDIAGGPLGKTWSVVHVKQASGRPLPAGVYAIDAVIGCRLHHFGVGWKVNGTGIAMSGSHCKGTADLRSRDTFPVSSLVEVFRKTT